jgi:capsule biosynthesis phosphatase
VIYVFDIDDTICKTKEGDYKNSKPIQERIDKVNKIYDEGHTVVFQTARGMGRSDNNVVWCYKEFYDFTRKQLNDWGVKYDDLFLGKPSGDIYIDDKGIKDGEFFREA